METENFTKQITRIYNENQTVCAKPKYFIKGASEMLRSERSSIRFLKIYTALRVSYPDLEN
jgi:hypothetical protein